MRYKQLLLALCAIIPLMEEGIARDRNPTLVPIGISRSKVEQQIVVNFTRMETINVSVGDDPQQFIFDRPNLFEGLVRKIAGRLRADLMKVYKGKNLEKSEGNYLLISKRREYYIAYVVRVSGVSANGEYVPLDGLAYKFRSVDGYPVEVSPTSY
jgi:hypothetical protein